MKVVLIFPFLISCGSKRAQLRHTGKFLVYKKNRGVGNFLSAGPYHILREYSVELFRKSSSPLF